MPKLLRQQEPLAAGWKAHDRLGQTDKEKGLQGEAVSGTEDARGHGYDTSKREGPVRSPKVKLSKTVAALDSDPKGLPVHR